jgi:hypothetical protein
MDLHDDEDENEDENENEEEEEEDAGQKKILCCPVNDHIMDTVYRRSID